MAITFPVFEKTWLDPHYYLELPQQANGTLTIQVAFLGLKNGLKGLPTNPWTCKGSSDATTAGMDGTDRLTDTTKVIASAAGNRSWIVLGNVDGLQILCDFGVANVSQMKVQMSVAAGFTGGSITAAPTATDQELCVPTAAGGGSDRWLFDGTSTVARLHLYIMHSTDGKNTMAFIMFSSTIQSIWILGRFSDPVPGFTTPILAYVDGITTNGTSTTAQSYTRLLTRAQVMSHNGANSVPMVTSYLGWGNFGATSINLAPGNMFFAEANSGSWQIWPMGLVCKVSGVLGRHGRFTDLWRVPQSVPSGYIFHNPQDETQALVNFGSLLVPCGTKQAIRVV